MTKVVERLRQTRANMLGTEDEAHYWTCHEAADELEGFRQREVDYLNMLLRQSKTIKAQWKMLRALKKGELVNDLPDWIFDTEDNYKAPFIIEELKESYSAVLTTHRGVNNDRDKEYCKRILDAINEVIDFYVTPAEAEDWEEEKLKLGEEE